MTEFTVLDEEGLSRTYRQLRRFAELGDIAARDALTALSMFLEKRLPKLLDDLQSEIDVETAPLPV
ncbi:MAG: hypothetical protein U1E45_13290 [Geminicoccaceae bacterium]